jgi:hypothetical protein
MTRWTWRPGSNDTDEAVSEPHHSTRASSRSARNRSHLITHVRNSAVADLPLFRYPCSLLTINSGIDVLKSAALRTLRLSVRIVVNVLGGLSSAVEARTNRIISLAAKD